MIEHASHAGNAPLLRDNAIVKRHRRFPRFFRDPKAAVSVVLLICFVVLAIGSPAVAPYGENKQNLLASHKGPSLKHLLRTDRIGTSSVG